MNLGKSPKTRFEKPPCVQHDLPYHPLPPPKLGGDLAPTQFGKGSPPGSGRGQGVVIVRQSFPGAGEWADSQP